VWPKDNAGSARVNYPVSSVIRWVVRQVGKDAPDTPARVRLIALVARDQVHMQMRDGLFRGGADVDTDIEPVRRAVARGIRGELGGGLAQCLPNLGHFVWSGVEEVGDMSARAD
jgi:hypothetical protein